ncbi:MAG: hypothetical protein ACOY3P_16415, partial [Planctomycetota bacterium]
MRHAMYRSLLLGAFFAIAAIGHPGRIAWAADTSPAKENSGAMKRCRLAAEYSAAHRGISMLVMLDGRIVFEHYPNGGRPDRAHELASGTKSFSGILAA